MALIEEGVGTSATRMGVAIRGELDSMFSETRRLVEEMRTSHQSQLDHVQNTNVAQEAFINQKHAEL